MENYTDPFVDVISGNFCTAPATEPTFYDMNEVDDKNKVFFEVSNMSPDTWRQKFIMNWSTVDIMNWIVHEAQRQDFDYEKIDMKAFRMSGNMLWNMSESEFLEHDPIYGRHLYIALQDLKCRGLPYPFHGPQSTPKPAASRDTLQFAVPDVQRGNLYYSPGNSDGESESSETPKESPKKSRGRRKQDKPTGRLWEFIRDLLLNRKYCPSLICWENYEEGVFRFVQSDQVAKLWGTRKQNPNMTYEKLSRAMRYYYKSQVLLPVLGRRLVYKFGPTATGWRTSNPNFTNPTD